jgi:heme/copper-type cytochrome/quinol oxidase subunit 2
MRSVNTALRQLVPVLLIVAVVAGAEAFGCPNCKDAVNTSDPDGLNVARGYFYSILLMLAMPLTLVSSFGAYVWREMRRQKAAAAAGETQEHSAP